MDAKNCFVVECLHSIIVMVEVDVISLRAFFRRIPPGASFKSTVRVYAGFLHVKHRSCVVDVLDIRELLLRDN